MSNTIKQVYVVNDLGGGGGGGVSGSGTAGTIAIWTSTTALGDSELLDNGSGTITINSTGAILTVPAAATGHAGNSLTIAATNAAAGSDDNGGNIILTPGLGDGTGVSGIIQINGNISTNSQSGPPTTSQIPSGSWNVWKDTSGGGIGVYANDGGTVKNLTFTPLNPSQTNYPVSQYSSNYYGPIEQLTAPPTSGWTQVHFSAGGNTTSVSQDATTSTIYMQDIGTASNGDILSLYAQAYPSSPFTITIGFTFNSAVNATSSSSNVFPNGGLAIRNSTSDKYELLIISSRGDTNAIFIELNTFNSYTSGYTNIVRFLIGQLGSIMFFRLQDDGANRYWSRSVDGVNFLQCYQESNTNFLTPNQIGIVSDPVSTVGGMVVSTGLTLFSWEIA